MRPHLECVACSARQAVEATRALNLSDEVGIRLLSRVLERLQSLDWRVPPPMMGRDLHRMVREELQSPDPYLGHKTRATERALELLPAAERVIHDSADPFYEAVRLSIAGNLIDLGAPAGKDVLVEDVIRDAATAPLDPDAVADLRRAVRGAESVLFLADNAGELVLDRPLLECIGADRVTVAVRGSPTINDATRDDAEASGITDRYRVIDNGTDIPGTWLPECSPAFVRAFDEADVVVAKGQGNYETLSEYAREVFFLFRVKCGSVSQDTGIPVGSFVALRKPPDQCRDSL